jgi:hypothetical protein
MNTSKVILVFALVISLAGCAGVQGSQTDEVLRQPLGSGGLSLGMTRSQVAEKYGQPDMKGMVSSSEWKSQREEWVYSARYSSLPFNAGYLSDDLYLYFDGDNLTNISKSPLGADTESDTDVK